MTINEIRNAFMLRMRREAFKRQVDLPQIDNTEIALLVSEAEQDLQEKLLIVESSATVTLTSGVGNLPANCGKIRAVRSGSTFLDERSADEVTRMQAHGSSSDASVFARQTTGGTETLLVYPTGAESVVVYFYVDTLFHQPSASEEYWGSASLPYSSGDFSGNLLLPARFSKAIQYHMVSEYFDDYLLRYQSLVNQLKGSSRKTISSPKYMFGGLEEDGVYEETRSQNASIQTSGGGDVYEKHVKIYCEEGSSTFQETLPSTFNSITKSLVGNVLYLTSSDFVAGKTMVDCSRSMNWTFSDTNQIAITFYPTSGWVSATVEVHVDT
jgi:hypothetical protein